MLEILMKLCWNFALILQCLFLDQGGQSRRFSVPGLGFEKRGGKLDFSRKSNCFGFYKLQCLLEQVRGLADDHWLQVVAILSFSFQEPFQGEPSRAILSNFQEPVGESFQKMLWKAIEKYSIKETFLTCGNGERPAPTEESRKTFPW